MVKIIFIFCFIPSVIIAQSNIDKAISYLQQFSTEDHDFEILTLSLGEYENNPINLNYFSLDACRSFPLFNQKHWSAINKYRRINGLILSYNELLTLSYFSEELIELIKPFTTLKTSPTRKRNGGFIIHKSNRIMESCKGFIASDSSRFLGSKTQETTRLNLNKNNQQFFVTWKKDRGENLKASHIKAGYSLASYGAVKSVNIGSFSAHFGEGLIHSNKFISPKNLPPEQLFKLEKRIKRNGGASNFNFENGGAIEFRFKNLNSTFFISQRQIHGSIRSDTLRSIKSDDYFRTYNDFAKVNVSNYHSLGSAQEFTFGNTSISLNSKIHIQKHYYQPVNNYYNSNYDHQNLINHSIAFRYFNGNIFSRGEAALDKENDFAINYFVGGKMDQLSILLNARFFEPNYNSHRTNTFSESSHIQNERAVFLSSQYNINKTSFLCSVDLFAFPEPKFLIQGPSFGKELVLFVNSALRENIKFKLYHKIKQRLTDNSTPVINQKNAIETSRSYGQIDLNIDKQSYIKLRLDQNYFQSVSETSLGYSAFIQYGVAFKNQSFNLRLTSFNIPNWNSRIHLYENDVLYHFSVPALNGKGIRFFINTKRNFGQKITLWAKYGQFYFPEKTTIGTGKDEIKGNTKSELRLQLKIKI